jgi:hypothetical protein
VRALLEQQFMWVDLMGSLAIGGICVPIIWRPVAFLIALPFYLLWYGLRD